MSKFEDALGPLFERSDVRDLLGGRTNAQRAQDTLHRAAHKIAKEQQPLPQLRRKTINDVAYIRADDVAALLDVIGGARARNLAQKLRRKP